MKHWELKVRYLAVPARVWLTITKCKTDVSSADARTKLARFGTGLYRNPHWMN